MPPPADPLPAPQDPQPAPIFTSNLSPPHILNYQVIFSSTGGSVNRLGRPIGLLLNLTNKTTNTLWLHSLLASGQKHRWFTMALLSKTLKKRRIWWNSSSYGSCTALGKQTYSMNITYSTTGTNKKVKPWKPTHPPWDCWLTRVISER